MRHGCAWQENTASGVALKLALTPDLIPPVLALLQAGLKSRASAARMVANRLGLAHCLLPPTLVVVTAAPSRSAPWKVTVAMGFFVFSFCFIFFLMSGSGFGFYAQTHPTRAAGGHDAYSSICRQSIASRPK